ncbi:4Fe-4S binding protein [Defluviimonas aestuarii]|uniref:NosR/NirI family protein n=1 Tax=Albidovulum aestuarii TaxID=1130726 RepID=UPI00249AB2AE|nr:NosR/NirI family protein [Defluviimonas aestuarii]MDI3337616.1 4Fe-4S binding protein [Defluviimonas aestuarii]
MRFLVTLIACVMTLAAPCSGAGLGLSPDVIESAAPDAALAEGIFGGTGLSVARDEAGVPGWTVRRDGAVIGHIGSTWEIAGSVGYSGRPLDVLVAIAPDARIAGARLMQHNEPVLTLGISDEDIAAYVNGFAGYDLTEPRDVALANTPGLPDVISRATVSTGVIRDGILRTARTLAIGRGILAEAGGIDRLSHAPADWQALVTGGALAESLTGMDEAAEKLTGAKVPVTPGPGDFLHLWTGLIDPPAVGQNLLGQQGYTAAIGALGPGETLLIVISSGLHSHRGTVWRKTGTFDRIAVIQGQTRLNPTEASYRMVKKLAIDGAPNAKEISLFRLPPEIDPLEPFRVEVTAARPTETGEVAMTMGVDYRLPDTYRIAPPPDPAPLWREIWQQKRLATGIVAAMLAVLTLILFAQEWIIRRPKLWMLGRVGFLLTTLIVLGWGLNGQLSVVQVVAFVHSLLTGFRWETFLIEPVIFLLWSFTALGMLFWGRGVYCGWLCPFGALQELTNLAARRLGVKQIDVPQAVHERLWVIKYTLFMAILALSFYSMHDALVLAEAEPFKTAISLRMIRAWPFLLYVAVLLGAGLFIERFFCRYLCPLGAGIAIPAKLKIFDWLKRRPQCGRECRLCETKCTVGAIDPLGRINANECVLCLRCQVIMNNDAVCPVLKRRARAASEATT